MNPNSFTEIKKHVTGGARTSSGYALPMLHVGEHAGEMWATNTYWAVRASRVAPLLEKFNLDPRVAGSYEVNGSVRPAPALSGVKTGEFLAKHLDTALYTVGMVPSLVGGKQVYVRTDTGSYRAVYQAAGDGAYLAIAADELEWVSSTWSTETPEDCYHGPVRYLAAVPGKGTRVVGIIADLIHRVSPVSHGTGPDGEPTRRGGETENLGPRIIAIIAAQVLEAGK